MSPLGLTWADIFNAAFAAFLIVMAGVAIWMGARGSKGDEGE